VVRIAQKNNGLAFAILIGGKSSRFGSDKGIFEFQGKPLISYQLEVLSKFDKDIFLVAKSREQVQKYANEIDITDLMGFIVDDRSLVENKNLRTPMIGLYSVFKDLKELKYQKLFVLSCDMPLIQKEIIELLIQECYGYDCCIPKWDNGFVEPLFGIYPIIKAYKKSKQFLQEGVYKLIKFFENDWKMNYIPVEGKIQQYDTNLLTFININAPVDLEELMKLYNAESK
jgi:molybdopterin-guanine dinucleotide biosynthesis protein A